MRFTDLTPGAIFFIDGAPYEADIIGDRVVVAYLLQEVGHVTMDRLPEYDSHLERVNDPEDLAGDQFLTTAFSDLRFDLNNLTDFERQCDEDLKNIL